MKKTGKKKGVIIITIILLILLIFISVYFVTKQLDLKNFTNNTNSTNKVDSEDDINYYFNGDKLSLIAEYDEIYKIANYDYKYDPIKVSDKYFIVKKNDKYGVIDFNGKVIEEIKYNYIENLSDEYYLINDNGTRLLKRNGNLVADVTNYKNGKVYKDNTDSKSLYIMLNEYLYSDSLAIGQNSDVINLGGNLRAVYYKDNQVVSGIDLESSSIIYDASTGKILKKIPGMINKTDSSYYYVGYSLATYMTKGTYYDNNFNDLLADKDYYFYSMQCDGNDYSGSIVTNKPGSYGYFSTNKKELILPIEYQNIYSSNENETLFSVKKNDKFGLVDDKNTILLPIEYDYILVINNYYVAAVKDNNLFIYDKDLNSIDDYKFIINKNIEVAMGGLCEPEYKFIDVQKYWDDDEKKFTDMFAKLKISTTSGIKTLYFHKDKIKLFDDDNYLYLTGDSSLSNNQNYVVISNIKDNFINNISVYNYNLEKLYDIDVSSYNISLDNNTFPDDYVSSVSTINFEFDCKNFIISYDYDENYEHKEIYFDLGKKKIVDNITYEGCKAINNNYFYYPTYTADNRRDKNNLCDNNNDKILEFNNDIEMINDNYFLVDDSKLYKIN